MLQQQQQQQQQQKCDKTNVTTKCDKNNVTKLKCNKMSKMSKLRPNGKRCVVKIYSW